MFCPECGSKNLENANFCKECGFDFNHEIRTVEIQKPLKTQVNEIGIYTEDLDIPYQEISKIKAKVGAATAFSKSPTIEDINFKLQEEASKKGANAIIKVKYNRGISLTSWKSMSATGIAILMESDEKKCPFCAEMIKKKLLNANIVVLILKIMNYEKINLVINIGGSMSADVESVKVYCKFCGFEIKKDAQFCKNCGKSFNEEYNFISRINGKINILSVFIGLIVSVIVLLIGASFFGVIITAKIMDVTLYLFLVLFVMLFLGGFITGITGSRNINEGLINGTILSLIAFIILGFIFGTYLLVIVGITSAIASAFSSFGSASASNVSSPSITGDNLFILMKGILIIITCFFAGTGGGALGAWIIGDIK